MIAYRLGVLGLGFGRGWPGGQPQTRGSAPLCRISHHCILLGWELIWSNSVGSISLGLKMLSIGAAF